MKRNCQAAVRCIPPTVTLTTAISASAQIVNGDASMGQQLAQKWCNDCHAVGAEDAAEAYGSAQLCFDRGNVFQYWRTSAFLI